MKLWFIVENMTKSIAQIRDEAAAQLSHDRQQQWEQFLTPLPVAQQAVSLFSSSTRPVRILDLGSGTGILGALVARHAPVGSSVVAVEQDHQLALASQCSLRQVCDSVKVINSSVFDILLEPEFDRVILNPPYKKIRPTVMPSASGGVKVTNLYAAFLVIAIQALHEGGECVAIIPRSWMNGEYFKDFRKWLLRECSIETLAVYASRQDHFSDMGILQEIMLLKVAKRAQIQKTCVYDAVVPVKPLEGQRSTLIPLNLLTLGKDRILRLRQADNRLSDFGTLMDQELWVSTGKLVWFRNRDILAASCTEGGHPLYWAENQRGLQTVHPLSDYREQWVTKEADNRNVVIPSGSYCLINRFSAKEQKRRIYASYLNSSVPCVVDNKLNYVHQGTSRKTVPLDGAVARGLTIWLSTSIVDEWYRQVSGSTQVNATDLRQLPCPTRKQLYQLAKLMPITKEMNQEAIDQTVGGMFSWTRAS